MRAPSHEEGRRRDLQQESDRMTCAQASFGKIVEGEQLEGMRVTTMEEPEPPEIAPVFICLGIALLVLLGTSLMKFIDPKFDRKKTHYEILPRTPTATLNFSLRPIPCSKLRF